MQAVQVKILDPKFKPKLLAVAPATERWPSDKQALPNLSPACKEAQSFVLHSHKLPDAHTSSPLKKRQDSQPTHYTSQLALSLIRGYWLETHSQEMATWPMTDYTQQAFRLYLTALVNSKTTAEPSLPSTMINILYVAL